VFKLPFLSLLIAIAVSSSVITCDFCDEPDQPPANKLAAGAAPLPLPQG